MMPRRNLTAEEEVTLRRVAYGQSPARTLRAQDLEALRGLRLIVDHRDGPLLTAEGRRLFDTLPRASAQAGREPMEAMLAELTRVTRGNRR
jgi:DNA-binding transcriptional LysR family regulator